MTARPLRVFHLIKGLGRGGAEMLLTDGPRASDPAEFSYGFGYFLPHKDALVAEIEQHLGQVECFSARSPLAMSGRVFEVARYIKRWRADVLHCHLPLAGVVGRLAGRLAGVPVVYTEHNLIERYHPATRLAARATWPLQAQVIAVSAEVASSVRQHLGARVPVSVVENGVSVERFTPTPEKRAQARQELGLEPGAFVVGSIAVFRKQKRLDLWLDLAARVAAQHPSARFLLVGDGPLRDEVTSRAQQLRLTGKLLRPGLQRDVRPYLAAMDTYLITSDFEGLPIALLEAMSSALAPVSTDAGGIPEVIEPGRSGFVVPRGDSNALYAALVRVLQAEPGQREAWGAAARQRIVERFSIARMTRRLEQVYRNVATAS